MTCAWLLIHLIMQYAVSQYTEQLAWIVWSFTCSPKCFLNTFPYSISCVYCLIQPQSWIQDALFRVYLCNTYSINSHLLVLQGYITLFAKLYGTFYIIHEPGMSTKGQNAEYCKEINGFAWKRHPVAGPWHQSSSC